MLDPVMYSLPQIRSLGAAEASFVASAAGAAGSAAHAARSALESVRARIENEDFIGGSKRTKAQGYAAGRFAARADRFAEQMSERGEIELARLLQALEALGDDRNVPAHLADELDVRRLLFDQVVQLSEASHQFRTLDVAEAAFGPTRLLVRHFSMNELIAVVPSQHRVRTRGSSTTGAGA